MKSILFCGNAKVFDGMMTTMLSIFKRSASKEGIRFYIFTMNLTRLKADYTALGDAQAEFLDELA